MDKLIRDTLSQIRKVVVKENEVTIFLNPEANKKTFVDCVLFHLRDMQGKEYGEHSSILQSESHSIGLKSISFRPSKEVDVSKAKDILFYLYTGEIPAMEAPFLLERV